MNSGLTQHKTPIMLLIAILISTFITAYNGAGILSLLFGISHVAHLNLRELEWVVVIFTLMATASIAFFGQLSDHIGSLPCLLGGSVLFFIGSIFMVATHSSAFYILGRAVQGVATGILIPTSLVALQRYCFTSKQMATLVWSSISMLGFALAPIIVGLFFGYHVRGIFWSDLALLAITICILIGRMAGPREFFAGTRRKLGVWSTMTWLCFVVSLCLLVLQGHQWGWASFALIVLYIITPLFFVLFVIINHNSHEPIIPFSFFRNKIYVVANVMMFAAFFILYGLMYMVNFYLQSPIAFAKPILSAAITLLALTLPTVICSSILGLLDHHTRNIWVVRLGVCILFAGCLSLYWMRAPVDIVNFWWHLLLIGVGIGLTFPLTTSMAFKVTNIKNAGSVSGTLNSINLLGSTFGVVFWHVWFSKLYFHHPLAHANLLGVQTLSVVNRMAQQPLFATAFSHSSILLAIVSGVAVCCVFGLIRSDAF
ncbi:MAG: MFS transporter [Gammaproteobacteria bacterium]|nr:MFS transporter [Gammaproteobacteria bacterium]